MLEGQRQIGFVESGWHGLEPNPMAGQWLIRRRCEMTSLPPAPDFEAHVVKKVYAFVAARILLGGEEKTQFWLLLAAASAHTRDNSLDSETCLRPSF